MKEKILQALKTKYNNLGLGQKAFDGVAAFLEKTITKEEEIETAITAENVSNLLKAFQGESDSLRTARQAAEKALADYKAAHPDTTTTPADDPIAKKLAELEQKQKDLEQREKDAAARAQREAIVANLDTLLKEKGCDNDFIRKTTLAGIEIKDSDTAESLYEAYKAKYDTNYTEAYGNAPISPEGRRTPVEYKQGDYKSEVERLRAEGLLPPEQK